MHFIFTIQEDWATESKKISKKLDKFEENLSLIFPDWDTEDKEQLQEYFSYYNDSTGQIAGENGI